MIAWLEKYNGIFVLLIMSGWYAKKYSGGVAAVLLIIVVSVNIGLVAVLMRTPVGKLGFRTRGTGPSGGPGYEKEV